MYDLDGKNITNLQGAVPELLSVLREYDRDQILRALDGKDAVKPLDLLWAHDWDVRDLASAETLQA